MNPIIGICANYSRLDEIGIRSGLGVHGQEWQLVANDYIEAVEEAGGIPLILPITKEIKLILKFIEKLDGVLFTGGTDIDPQLYGEYPRFGLEYIDPIRDAHEIALAKHVLFKTEIPILGICRGLQLLNVVAGGTLYQDIKEERPKSINHTLTKVVKYQPVHPVQIKKNSKFHDIFKTEILYVNSFNHQAIKKLGKGFEATMIAPDGLIEGIESEGDRFVCGVQWHPEMMIKHFPEMKLLFNSFILHCRR